MRSSYISHALTATIALLLFVVFLRLLLMVAVIAAFVLTYTVLRK